MNFYIIQRYAYYIKVKLKQKLIKKIKFYISLFFSSMTKLRKKKGSVSFSNETFLTKSSNLNKLRTNSIEKKKYF